jgi:hypothetical protein
MKQRVIETNIIRALQAIGLTFYPFIFVAKGLDAEQRASLLTHENVHWEQQRTWAKYSLGLGLLAWYALYLLALPVGWNPWRRKWEAAAMKVQGRTDAEILERLKHAPYYLWFLK